MCVASKVVEGCIQGYFAIGTKTELKGYRRPFIRGEHLERCTQHPNKGAYVKHISRRHNQEDDLMANLGAEGVTQVTVESCKNSTITPYEVFWTATKRKTGAVDAGS